MFDPQRFLNNPEYLKLTPDEQREARQVYFESVINKDATYKGMAPVAQEALKRQFGVDLGGGGKTLKQRTGFGEVGLVEGLTGSQLGKAIDIPLSILSIPGALAGTAVEGLTGSTTAGDIAAFGTDIVLGGKGLGALKRLRGVGKSVGGAAPAMEEGGQHLLPGISSMAKAVKAPSFEEGALKAKSTLSQIEGLSKPQTSRELQLSMQRGLPEVEQLPLNFPGASPSLYVQIRNAIGSTSNKDAYVIAGQQKLKIQQSNYGLLGRMLGDDDVILADNSLISIKLIDKILDDSGKVLFDKTATVAQSPRIDWRAERYPNVGIQLVGSANATFEKLWGKEQAVAEPFRQIWGKHVPVFEGTFFRGERAKPIHTEFRTDPGDLGAGKYYASSEAHARAYGKVTKERVTLERPLFLSSDEAAALSAKYQTVEAKTIEERLKGAKQLTVDLQRQGYDGLVVRGYEGPGEVTVVKFGQAGYTKLVMLLAGAGAAIGGAIGGARAEEPENRMRDALIGAGIGGAAAGILLGMGKSTPVLAGLGGALIKEGKGYQAVTKTGKIAGMLETDAAPIQIAEAAKLSSAARGILPQGLQDAVQALDGEGINLGIFHAKTRLEQITPRLFGLTPRDLARNAPAMHPIADTLEAGADTMKVGEGWFIDNLNAIYHSLKHASKEKVNAFLDGQGGTLSQAEQSVATNARALLNKAADLLNLPRDMRLSDYFPRVRDVIAASPGATIDMGGRAIPIKGMVELVKGQSYIPLRVENSVPKVYTPFFAEKRTTELAATKISMEPLIAYGRGFGRSLALNGGKNPYTGEQITGVLAKLKAQLPNLPDDKGVLEYNAKWINDFLGIPTGVKGGVFGENTKTVVAELKKMQFLRTLALNPLSAALNLTQSLNTFAKSSVGAWLGAFSDITDPVKRLMAKQYGIVGDIAKADIDALRSTPFDQLSSQLLNKMGFMFKGSETLVRQHAFFTGLRDAAKQGIKGEDAITYARRLVSETQFRFGKEGLPATFRAEGGGMGELIQQFKTYPVNQMLFMKNLLVDDISDLTKMQGIPFKRLGKFFGAMFALVGSDATTMGLDKSMSKFFTDNEEQLRVTGFFPSLGIHIAGQLGMGVMPVENLRSLFFFLPGPMASMVMDGVSTGSILVNHGSPTAPWGINYSPGPGFGEPMTADQAGAKLTRMIPFAGVMLNRLRRAYLETQTPGEVREAATIRQAFGVEPFTGGEKLIASVDKAGSLRTLGGVQSPERAARLELGGEQVELIQARNLAVKNAARLVAVGQQEKALKLLDAFEKKYGIAVRLSPQAIRSALLSANIPVEERRARKAPRELRGLLRSELEDLD